MVGGRVIHSLKMVTTGKLCLMFAQTLAFRTGLDYCSVSNGCKQKRADLEDITKMTIPKDFATS